MALPSVCGGLHYALLLLAAATAFGLVEDEVHVCRDCIECRSVNSPSFKHTTPDFGKINKKPEGELMTKEPKRREDHTTELPIGNDFKE